MGGIEERQNLYNEVLEATIVTISGTETKKDTKRKNISVAVRQRKNNGLTRQDTVR